LSTMGSGGAGVDVAGGEVAGVDVAVPELVDPEVAVPEVVVRRAAARATGVGTGFGADEVVVVADLDTARRAVEVDVALKDPALTALTPAATTDAEAPEPLAGRSEAGRAWTPWRYPLAMEVTIRAYASEAL